jgi:hypothetical protein
MRAAALMTCMVASLALSCSDEVVFEESQALVGTLDSRNPELASTVVGVVRSGNRLRVYTCNASADAHWFIGTIDERETTLRADGYRLDYWRDGRVRLATPEGEEAEGRITETTTGEAGLYAEETSFGRTGVIVTTTVTRGAYFLVPGRRAQVTPVRVATNGSAVYVRLGTLERAIPRLR